MYLVTTRNGGPAWQRARALSSQAGWCDHAAFMNGLVDDGFVVLGGTLDDGERTVLVVDSKSEQVVRRVLSQDPWSESHLRIEAVEHWTIRLDGRVR
jgi:hypothetical protein